MKFYVVAASIAILFFSSCSKNNVSPPKKDPTTTTDTTKVTIKGVDYPVVTIGKQRWTAINYNGPGGYDLTPAGSAADWGRLYSRSAAMAVNLPDGWRLPTNQDYISMYTYVIKNSGYYDTTYKIYAMLLAAPTGWLYFKGNGKFNAYPYGDVQILTGHIYLPEYMGYIAQYWTSSTYSIGGITYYNAFEITTVENPQPSLPDQVTIENRLPVDTIFHLPVRFVKDVN